MSKVSTLLAIIVIGTAAAVCVPIARPDSLPATALSQHLPTAAAKPSDDATDDAHRIQNLEQLRTQFPPEKSERSYGPMRTLFELYLRTDSQKAVKLAQQMQATGAAMSWLGRAGLAQEFIEVNQRLSDGKASEALALVSKLKPEQYSSEDSAMIGRFNARLMAGAGQSQAAYPTLLRLQSKAPEDETETLLQEIGKQLHKSPTQVRSDLKATLYAEAKPAPPFNLRKYTSDERVSLAKLRGKVVLLTFWFPSCGPCVAEFSHFETVMQRLRQKGDDVSYIGINVVRDQDSYVLPLIAKKKYSFTALKGPEAVQGAKSDYAIPRGYAIRGAPTNFVIARSGKIVYRDFTIDDAQGELMLQRMIESVLEAPT